MDATDQAQTIAVTPTRVLRVGIVLMVGVSVGFDVVDAVSGLHYCDMVKKLRGLYRIPGWAYVTDEAVEFDLSEARYRQRHYEPAYDKLPTKEAYDDADITQPGEKLTQGLEGGKTSTEVIGADRENRVSGKNLGQEVDEAGAEKRGAEKRQEIARKAARARWRK